MFELQFDTDNDAFYPSPPLEAAAILRRVANDIDRGKIGGHVHDSNGNDIGHWFLQWRER